MRTALFLALLLLATLVPGIPAAATGCSGGPTNDCMGAATEWFAQPASFSNVGATMEPGEPASCGGVPVHRSVWLTLEVLSPGGADSSKVTIDADFWATAAAYTKAADGTLTLERCHASWEDEGRHSPVLYLPCTPGRVYHIQLGGQSPSDVGSFSLYESRYWKFDMTMSEACPFKPSLPSEPRLSAPTGGNGKVSLGWTEPAWDGGRSVSVSHYNVYGAPTCASVFSLLGTSSSRWFEESGLGDGESRCYQVSAVNPVGEGPRSAARSATTWDVPRAPVSLSVARGGDGELALSWSASPDAAGPAPMTAHRVYRAMTDGGAYILLGSTGATTRSFTDTGLGRGETAHYRVAAVNVVGEGAPGPSAAGTTWNTPGTPTGVEVRHQLSTRPVAFEVTWKAPADPTPFTHYHVYRSDSANGAAGLVGVVAASTTSFVDTGRLPLADHHYEVRAANPAGEGGASTRSCGSFPAVAGFGRCP